MKRSIYIGWDAREAEACRVAGQSILRHMSGFVPIHYLFRDEMRRRGLYTRPTELRDGRMWDVISDAPMATEHACARFLVPHLAKTGWALFMDGDMLVRGDLASLFHKLNPMKAVYCVQHRHEPPPGLKMDAQIQTQYARKNWSSFVIFNCDHPANKALTVDLVNTVPGRDLHRFCWLSDDLIGELPPEYNFLVGHTDPGIDPICVHFTDGVPNMPGYENVPFADEWRRELERQGV